MAKCSFMRRFAIRTGVVACTFVLAAWAISFKWSVNYNGQCSWPNDVGYLISLDRRFLSVRLTILTGQQDAMEIYKQQLERRFQQSPNASSSKPHLLIFDVARRFGSVEYIIHREPWWTWRNLRPLRVETNYSAPIQQMPIRMKQQCLWVSLEWLFFLIALSTAVLWWRGRKRQHEGHCRQCGYNMTGNVSGRCPECNTPWEVQPVIAK